MSNPIGPGGTPIGAGTTEVVVEGANGQPAAVAVEGGATAAPVSTTTIIYQQPNPYGAYGYGAYGGGMGGGGGGMGMAGGMMMGMAMGTMMAMDMEMMHNMDHNNSHGRDVVVVNHNNHNTGSSQHRNGNTSQNHST
jgi:hypothetical protein